MNALRPGTCDTVTLTAHAKKVIADTGEIKAAHDVLVSATGYSSADFLHVFEVGSDLSICRHCYERAVKVRDRYNLARDEAEKYGLITVTVPRAHRKRKVTIPEEAV